MAGGFQLKKGEDILKAPTKSTYSDINDILELYNIKKYIDNGLYLNGWTQDDIADYKLKATEYGKIVCQFISNINDSNIVLHYDTLYREYINSFWELVNNQDVSKRISKINFSIILTKEPHIIHRILTHKNLVEYYDSEIKNFLLTYSQSAEILLSIYEAKNEFNDIQMFVPKSLTIEDKENIVLEYLDSNHINLNYIELIENSRKGSDFRISDKTRLKAKRLHESETEKLFAEQGGVKYGVSISFPENATKIKDGFIDDEHIVNYSYSLDFIKKNKNPYSLFLNFKYLFEYLDKQNRINLVSKKSQMSIFERFMGIHSQNEYRGGTAFSLSEMTSQAQIYSYNKIVCDLNSSLENILNFVFSTAFQEEYDFADNASFNIPTATNSYFEKVRLLAPEFESVLKQFKLFVEDGNIDFELLQISSAPSAIKDIPSLNEKKYMYFNKKNTVMVGCVNLFFSDQTLLAYIEPFKEKQYHNFFDLIAKEQVKFNNYEEHQKLKLNHLIDNGFISIDINDFIQISNPI